MIMIQVLSNETIQKIAAGEVIERPVSVVKELVENAIDAGADSIIVEIRKGGKEYIQVQDNGSGIEKSDFQKAFERHATSKITDFDDLYRIHSLGFRGEALASIVSVARVTARSKTEDELTGSQLQYEDARLISQEPIAMSRGTEMVIEDLFYNVPVRKKFLKTDQAEGNQITSLLYSLAVGNPDISIQFVKDDRNIFQTNKDNSFEENLMVLFGLSYFERLKSLDSESDSFRLHGSIGDNNFFRANRQMQFLYVNGRYVEHEEIRKIIEDQYKAVIPNGRFPAYQLFIETDPSNIDINIHPNKQKINFFEFDELAELVEHAIRDTLFARPTMAKIDNMQEKKTGTTIFQDLSSDDAYNKILEAYQWSPSTKMDLLRESAQEEEQSNSTNHQVPSADLTEDSYINNIEITEIEETDRAFDDSMLDLETVDEESKQEEFNDLLEEETILPAWHKLQLKGTVFRTYILLENPSNGELIFMDQHAAHERINYEKFISQFNNKEIVSQVLAHPDHLKLTELQSQEAKAKTSLLEEMGFSFSFLGDRDLVVREVPVFFHQPELEDTFLALLDTDISTLNSMEETVHKLATKACKASVKQGDVLSSNEIEALYHELSRCEYPLTCPHGRPTLISVTKKDLEKLFYRIK